MHIFITLFSTVLEVSTRVIRQEKEIENTQIGMEEYLTLKLLEKNKGQTPHKFGFGNHFFDYVSKDTSNKRKNKVNKGIIRTIYASKLTIRRIERQPME